MPTETGLVRLRVASLPRLAWRVADSSTVWRLLLRDSSVRLSKMAMISPASRHSPASADHHHGACRSAHNHFVWGSNNCDFYF